jgi:hypothetical protein
VPNPKFKCQIPNPKLFWIWAASIFTIRHTGINIANAIKSVLTEFNLLEKTLALTTDKGSDIYYVISV